MLSIQLVQILRPLILDLIRIWTAMLVVISPRLSLCITLCPMCRSCARISTLMELQIFEFVSDGQAAQLVRAVVVWRQLYAKLLQNATVPQFRSKASLQFK